MLFILLAVTLDLDPVMQEQIQAAIKLLDTSGNGVVSYVGRSLWSRITRYTNTNTYLFPLSLIADFLLALTDKKPNESDFITSTKSGELTWY